MTAHTLIFSPRDHANVHDILSQDISALDSFRRGLIFTSNTRHGKNLFRSLLRFGVLCDVARSPEKVIEFFVYSLSRRPYDFVVFDPDEPASEVLRGMVAEIVQKVGIDESSFVSPD